jgi:hypothetical protein
MEKGALNTNRAPMPTLDGHLPSQSIMSRLDAMRTAQ